MFDADRPILTSEQDRLGRAVFGKYLARCILDHTNPESLVIGLYGASGSGKTSIINLTLQELRYASNNMFDNEKPIILNFSPWSYSGQGELVYSFFRRLSAEMRSAEYFENSEKIIHLMELYISFFTHKPVPKALRPKHFWGSRWFRKQREMEESYGWESGRDLTLVKAELNQLLSKSAHKIIIFIDNVSRVQPEEMKQLFQIVKSMGDFANTVYILAMDKEYILRVLHQSPVYLEKMVQLPFEIPPIAKQDIETILLDRLEMVVQMVPEDSWDTAYWGDIYYSSLKYFFENCRDITRYINTLSFSYVHVKEVVNPVDFFAITAVEVFEPSVFYGIRDNKDLFVDMAEDVFPFTPEKLTEDRIRVEEIISRAKKIPQKILQNLMIRLFPHLRRVYETDINFYHSESIARKNKRICSYDLFEVYFRMTLGNDDISTNELNAILTLTSDEEGFALALLRLNQDNRIPKFLDTLDNMGVNRIALEDIPNVVNALVDSADLFPQGESTSLRLDTPKRLHRIFHQLLRRFDQNEMRFEIFREAIKKSTKSLFIIIHEIVEQGKEHAENADTFIPVIERDFNGEQLLALQALAVEKIKYWADIGRLVEHPRLLPILLAWHAWGDEKQCNRYVEHIVQSDRGLIAFLYAALQIPVMEAIKKEEINPLWKQHLVNIESFISAENLVPHARELFQNDYFVKLKETEQLTLLIFLDLVRPNTVKVFPKAIV